MREGGEGGRVGGGGGRSDIKVEPLEQVETTMLVQKRRPD